MRSRSLCRFQESTVEGRPPGLSGRCWTACLWKSSSPGMSSKSESESPSDLSPSGFACLPLPRMRRLVSAPMAAQCERKLVHTLTSWSFTAKISWRCACRTASSISSKPRPFGSWGACRSKLRGTRAAGGESPFRGLGSSAIQRRPGECFVRSRRRFSAAGSSFDPLASAAGPGAISSNAGGRFSRRRRRFIGGPSSGGAPPRLL
mmetsp:Transcript_37272/g.115843  ORF Transcript_37272/g.115843 Transcript_37272/m.115843 type:complete len:205 (+) Transcript_37272:783-1397(+)